MAVNNTFMELVVIVHYISNIIRRYNINNKYIIYISMWFKNISVIMPNNGESIARLLVCLNI